MKIKSAKIRFRSSNSTAEIYLLKQYGSLADPTTLLHSPKSKMSYFYPETWERFFQIAWNHEVFVQNLNFSRVLPEIENEAQMEQSLMSYLVWDSLDVNEWSCRQRVNLEMRSVVHAVRVIKAVRNHVCWFRIPQNDKRFRERKGM